MGRQKALSKLSSHSVDQFLEKLGSSDSVPGGGAAAALVLAQAAALGEMVARINLRRTEKQGSKNSPSSKNISILQGLRKKFLVLLEEDAKAFLALSKFKKEERHKAAYQKALRKAAGVPDHMSVLAKKASAVVLSEKSRTSAWLLSDLEESLILFEAGRKAARLNVEINLASMKIKKKRS